MLSLEKTSMNKVPGTYEKLYDITKEHLKQAGMELDFTKDAFYIQQKEI